MKDSNEAFENYMFVWIMLINVLYIVVSHYSETFPEESVERIYLGCNIILFAEGVVYMILRRRKKSQEQCKF